MILHDAAAGVVRRVRNLTTLWLFASATVAGASSMTVEPGWDPAVWVARNGPLELVLSRSPDGRSEELKVVIGALDVTDAFLQNDTTLSYDPTVGPLPSGPDELVVYLVDGPGGDWIEIGRFSISVRYRGGLERAEVLPVVEIDGAGQIAEGHRPDSNAPARERFFDATLRLGLRTDHGKGETGLASDVEIIGVTRQDRALRSGTLGDEAPRLDLARYTVRFRARSLTVEAGSIAIGQQPQLIDGFASRGLSGVWRPAEAVTVGAAVASATNIVGWDDILGIEESQHRVSSASLNLELLPGRPASIAVAATWVGASVQPLSGYTQGAVTDAEDSSGWGVRLSAHDATRRVEVDAGYSRSAFTNPEDPSMSAGAALVPVVTTEKSSRYARVAFQALRGARLTDTNAADLSLGYRHERIDPLYRSPTAFVRADQQTDRFEGSGTLGPVGYNLAYTRAEDNLDDIPSILKTRTENGAAGLSVPLARLLAPGSTSSWWPILSVGYDRVHQYGLGRPEDGGFSPSHVPDQVSQNRRVSADWTGDRWRVGAAWTSLDQDNRQPGREDADFANSSVSVSGGLSVARSLDIVVDLARERVDNIEIDEVEDTWRLGGGARWRIGAGHELDVQAAWSESNVARGERRNEDLTGDATWSWRPKLGAVFGRPVAGRIFLRFSNRRSLAVDPVFGIFDDRSAWTLTTGLNLSWGL